MNTEAIGLLAGLLGLLSVIPYCVRVWQRKIRPNPTSWFVWSLLSGILLFNYKETGVGASIWLAVVGFLNVGTVFVLTLLRQRSEWSKPDRLEVATLTIGMISVAYLLTSGQADNALYIGIFADIWAVAPTVRGAWRRPLQDRPYAWLMFAIASMISMFAITDGSLSSYALPVYYAIAELLVAIPLVLHRCKERIPLREWV
jgi:uncharacterized protein with PQ loop repeat